MISLNQLAQHLGVKQIQCLNCGTSPQGKHLQKSPINVGSYNRYYFGCKKCNLHNNFYDRGNDAKKLLELNKDYEYYFHKGKTHLQEDAGQWNISNLSVLEGYIIYTKFVKLQNFK